jgi:hypothetical protein
MQDSREERQYQNDLAARAEQRVYDRDALVRLVEDSEKAGFNPLTVLRNGGTSQFHSGEAPLSRPAGGNVGAGFADGISKVGDFLANYDPFADQKREQSYRLIESQISALNASTLSGVKRGRGSYASSDVDSRSTQKSAALASAGPWLDAPNKADGKGLALWVRGVDRDGKEVWVPNPDGPEIDQFFTPFLTRAQRGGEQFLQTLIDAPNQITVKQVPKKGGWRDWVPSFDFKWR